jgi:RecB family endonuclease NucS
MSNLAETLYYQVQNYVLLGQKEEAKLYLSFLREEYQQNPEKFNPLKNDHRWNHLVELGNVVDNNLIVKNFEKIDPAKEVVIKQQDELQVRKQRDLVNAICKVKDELKILLNAEDDFCCISTEVVTRFGRVDLLAQDSKTIYPIEVKKSSASHEVVTQIDKYILHYKLQLINRIYNHVIGVVIANSFTKYSLQELSRFGAIAIVYKFKGEDKIELERL